MLGTAHSYGVPGLKAEQQQQHLSTERATITAWREVEINKKRVNAEPYYVTKRKGKKI